MRLFLAANNESAANATHLWYLFPLWLPRLRGPDRLLPHVRHLAFAKVSVVPGEGFGAPNRELCRESGVVARGP